MISAVEPTANGPINRQSKLRSNSVVMLISLCWLLLFSFFDLDDETASMIILETRLQ